jgi:hypothetical protein
MPRIPQPVRPQTTGQEVAEPEEEPFGLLAWDRAKFFGEVILGLGIDSIFLIAAYGWYLIVHWAAGKFENVGEVEHWILVVLQYVLTIPPGLLVVLYVIIDFIGAVKRIWDKRA